MSTANRPTRDELIAAGDEAAAAELERGRTDWQANSGGATGEMPRRAAQLLDMRAERARAAAVSAALNTKESK
jgi:hypothetical protein